MVATTNTWSNGLDWVSKISKKLNVQLAAAALNVSVEYITIIFILTNYKKSMDKLCNYSDSEMSSEADNHSSS